MLKRLPQPKPNPNNMRWLLGCLVLAMLPISAEAAQVKIYVNSGTGFLVNRGGYLITNLHVVEQCQRIVVQSATLSARLARMIGRNQTHDLALLKIDGSGFEPGLFRVEGVPVAKGERVVVVGYPGESFRQMQTVTREAVVTNPKGPKGEDTWLQLSDTIEQGNSGGPLMDSAGNIIGVIVAKAVIYSYRTDAPQDGTTTHSGIAITLPVVRNFLNQYNVSYATSDANSVLDSTRITQYAERFVVNVRCETETEIR